MNHRSLKAIEDDFVEAGCVMSQLITMECELDALQTGMDPVYVRDQRTRIGELKQRADGLLDDLLDERDRRTAALN